MLNAISKWLTLLFLATLTLGFALFQTLDHFSHDLPDYTKLTHYEPGIISRVYSNSGDVIAEYANQRRIYVKYDHIPKLVINAFLSAEDENFFEHQGIDFYGTFRAAVQSILNIALNKRAVGGSTITQQVVKSLLLNSERTLSRKIKEAILAYKISQEYSKEQIIELYLNQIFLGNRTYGIAAAAQGYFEKELSELTVADAAMLAALPKAPSSLNPFVNYVKAKNRRDWVIRKMAQDGFISHLDSETFSKTEIALSTKKLSHDKEGNYYTEIVKNQVIELLGEEALYNKGLIIHTHFDSAIHKNAENAFTNGIIRYDRSRGWRGKFAHIDKIAEWREQLQTIKKPLGARNYEMAVILKIRGLNPPIIGLADGSTSSIKVDSLQWALPINKSTKELNYSKLFKVGDVLMVSKSTANSYALAQIPEIEGGMVVLEPYTGKVLSLIGGYDFARSSFNRALQAKRQPGSVFKPFVYLSALLEGYAPNTLVLDSPISISQGSGLPQWTPKNVTNKYAGLVTLRYAFEKSINIPTIRIAMEVGAQKIVTLAKLLNIYEQSTVYNAIALGTTETTLLNIANAYNIIASEGIRTKPRFVDSIYDREGNLLYRDKDIVCQHCFATNGDVNIAPEIKYQSERVIRPDVNYQLVSLLTGAMERGTGSQAQLQLMKKNIGGKTGTTNSSVDTWFIGFTPYVTAGVYVGYDTPKPMGKHAFGATVALPIFIDFMKNTTAALPDVAFQIPEGIHLKTVDRSSGKILGEAATTEASNTIIEAFKDSDLVDQTLLNKKKIQLEDQSDQIIANIIDTVENEY